MLEEINQDVVVFLDSQKEYWINLGKTYLKSIEIKGTLFCDLIYLLTEKLTETYDLVCYDSFQRSMELSQDYDSWVSKIQSLLN